MNQTNEKIIFTPVAGWTVDEAIKHAIKKAQETNKIVKLCANDIVLEIKPTTTFEKARELFTKKINKKNGIKTKPKVKKDATQKNDVIKFKPVPGYTFQFAIREAIQLAEMNDKLVKLEVNDVVLDITKKTDFVIFGEDAGSKYDKAKALGVKIIKEEELDNMFGGING